MRLRKIRSTVLASLTVLGVAVLSAPGIASASSIFGAGTDAGSAFENSLSMSKMSHSPFYSPRYVALGDSVAAGLGLPLVADASDEDTACGRSSAAYPEVIGERVNAMLSKAGIELDVENISCSGATTEHLTKAQPLSTALAAEPQLDNAFTEGTPTFLTLTMGANDARWGQFVGACLSAANCDTPENTATAQAYIDTMKTTLVQALDEIKARSDFIPPLTIVTGYYNPVSDRCASDNLTSGEIAWIGQEATALNKALEEATRQRTTGWFTHFAPVDFTGHDICSTDPWIQRPGAPNEPAPFHPTARGQQAIADAILAPIMR
jgi:lysophospholipase L1-like esterase